MFRRMPKTRPRPSFGREAVHALHSGPADERKDVVREVVAPSAAELMQDHAFQELLAVAKAEQQAARPRRGVAMSQIDVAGHLGQNLRLQRPVGLSFEQLRLVEEKSPILSLIVGRRVRQVERFLEQPQFEYQPGFQFRFKNRGRTMQDADRDRFMWLRNYLMNCGAEFDPRRRRAYQRDTLHEFTQKHVRDSLVGDAAPIEFVSTRSGNVHGFNAVDMATVFLTDPNQGLAEDFDGPAEFNLLTGRTSFGDPSNIIAVYAPEGIVQAQYTHMDLLYPVRNKTSREEQFGYGMPEIEGILQIVTAMTNAMTLNMRSVSDSSIPRGIWQLLGDFTPEQISAFKALVLAEMTGVQNRFRTPFVHGPADPGAGISFVPSGGQVEEAMYSRWWTLLVAIACAKYQMAPEEISHESFTAGRSSLSGSDTEAKLTGSEDAGLHSLLTWYGASLSEIVEILDPEVEFYWTGLSDTKEDDQAREQANMLYGEVRTRHGLSNDGISEEVLRAPAPVAGQVYMSTVQAKQQQDMMKQQAAMQPQPGQGGSQDDPQNSQDDSQGEADDPTTPTDPEHPSGPNGETRLGDHEGGVWQAHTPGDPDEPQPTMQKAVYQAILHEFWPEG